MKHRNICIALVVLTLAFFAGCDSERVDEFATFAAAGSQYVQNFHQVVAQAGTTMIAVDSAVYISARDPDVVKADPQTYQKELKQSDLELKQYLAALQLIDDHATLLGSYFDPIAQLASDKNATNMTAATNSLLDSINKLNPEIENATLKLGKVA
jgi:hypothetical protein